MKTNRGGDSEGEPEFSSFSQSDGSEESSGFIGDGRRLNGGHFRQSNDKTYDADSQELSEGTDSELVSEYDTEGLAKRLRNSLADPEARKRKKVTISQRLKSTISITNTSETEITSEEIPSDGGYGGASVADFFRGGWSNPKGGPPPNINGDAPKYSYTEDSPSNGDSDNSDGTLVPKIPADFNPDEPAGVIFCGYLYSVITNNNSEPSFFQPKPAFLETIPKVPTHGTMVDANLTFAVTGILKYTQRWTQEVITEQVNDLNVVFEWKWEFFPGL